MTPTQTIRAAATAIVATVAAFGVMAQSSYPDRPVRIIVGAPAGQSTDIIARLLGAKVSEYLKQPMVIDNKPGAGGIIGLEAAKSAAPDGYTLVIATGANMAINPSLYRRLPYDPAVDFDPIVTVVTSPLFLFTATATAISGAREISAYVRSHGAGVAYGSNGNGGTPHIAMEMFKKAANVEMLHVPYKGTPPLIADVLGGQVVFAFDAGPSILPLARDGRVKLLGVSSAQRTPLAPDVPTLAEQGFTGFAATTWAAVYAPRGTPAQVVETMNAAFNRALKDVAVVAELKIRGAQAVGGSAAELRSFQQTEAVRWGEAVRSSGAKVD
ncbi:tripartite tricarboxylate transporter substrate binding protein [Hydrogenophaga sp.]|uniref:Bug family tripartite tricarboxylate transporter substrate binding protein n=1 Tax=Hydrogenophaga sp. TaxID=1904254 RepID=UPI002720B544|nr:tripartite tricarboxylate transporter substrate binding protein [Hydrogenophaga sp.]MDO9435369.1 tripartite tricarboxylate transporter substrate binding protein [Hydrogenophaga sp.]